MYIILKYYNIKIKMINLYLAVLGFLGLNLCLINWLKYPAIIEEDELGCKWAWLGP